jgi:hypothetical protein
MTTPKSKLINDGTPGEAAPDALQTSSALEQDDRSDSPRRRGSPPPLPPSARAAAASGGPFSATSGTLPAPLDAETPAAAVKAAAAKTAGVRPGPTTETAIFPGHGVALEPDDSERSSAGFSALFEHTSLREWIRRIDSSQCDAVVTVSAELGQGELWCVAGHVIDAEWRAIDSERRFGGEDAAHQILTLRQGDVSVAFVPVDRPRRIALSTRQLLGKAARRSDRPSLSATPSELESTGVRPAPQRTTLFYRPTTTGVFPNTATQLTSPPAERRSHTATYLAGAVALVTLAATAFGIRQLASGPHGAAAEQVRVGNLKASVPVGAVEIEVAPPEAEIWLDSKRLGTGRVNQGPIRDGLVHQLRFMAPGYAPKSVFFRDQPAAGRVTLEPMASADLSLKQAAKTLRPALDQSAPDDPSLDDSVAAAPVTQPPGAVGSVAAAPPQTLSTTNAPRSAAGLTSTQNPVVSDSRRPERAADARASEGRASEAKHAVAPQARSTPAPTQSPPAPAKPQVQVIEVRTPRVQIID